MNVMNQDGGIFVYCIVLHVLRLMSDKQSEAEAETCRKISINVINY